MAETEKTTETLQNEFFLDLFRRADKNDNGELSLSEFLNYFRDGVMSADELTDLFNEIDTGKNGTVEIDELTAHFQKRSAEFKDVFDALSTVNNAASACLKATFDQSGSEADQFLTRFFFKEVSEAIQSIQTPIDDTHAAMVTKALLRRPDVYPLQTVLNEDTPRSDVKPGYMLSGRTASRSQLAPNPQNLQNEVNRLAVLVDKLSGKANFGSFEQTDDYCCIISYKMEVQSDKASQFQQDLAKYTAGLRFNPHVLKCMSCYDSDIVHLYEIWEDSEARNSHKLSDCYRDFHRSLVDTLAETPGFQQMDTPRSWWC